MIQNVSLTVAATLSFGGVSAATGIMFAILTFTPYIDLHLHSFVDAVYWISSFTFDIKGWLFSLVAGPKTKEIQMDSI